MIGPIGRQGQAATLGQCCPQMTRGPGKVMGAAEQLSADRPCKSLARSDDMIISLLYAVHLPKVACCSGDSK